MKSLKLYQFDQKATTHDRQQIIFKFAHNQKHYVITEKKTNNLSRIQVGLVIRYFGPRIVNSQIKRHIFTKGLPFETIVSNVKGEFADKKTAYNEVYLYSKLNNSLFSCFIIHFKFNSGIPYYFWFLH